MPLVCLDGDEIVEASLLGPADNGPRIPPTLTEEAVPLGDEPEPQEVQEATTCPCEHPHVLKPQEPAKQSDALHLPTPSPGSSGNQFQDTRRTWHRARPNDWIFAYLAKRVELPAWWLEFWSLHHWDIGQLSEAQVQELAWDAGWNLQATHSSEEKIQLVECPA